MTPTLTETAPGCFRVEGDVTFATIPPLWRKSRRQLNAASGQVVIDLAGVSQADSAALALLVEWLQVAERRGFTLCFRNLPPHLVAMAQTYDLKPILPVDG